LERPHFPHASTRNVNILKKQELNSSETSCDRVGGLKGGVVKKVSFSMVEKGLVKKVSFNSLERSVVKKSFSVKLALKKKFKKLSNSCQKLSKSCQKG
jgi:tyrosine-protein phosphatase YwqE